MRGGKRGGTSLDFASCEEQKIPYPEDLSISPCSITRMRSWSKQSIESIFTLKLYNVCKRCSWDEK